MSARTPEARYRHCTLRNRGRTGLALSITSVLAHSTLSSQLTIGFRDDRTNRRCIERSDRTRAITSGHRHAGLPRIMEPHTGRRRPDLEPSLPGSLKSAEDRRLGTLCAMRSGVYTDCSWWKSPFRLKVSGLCVVPRQISAAIWVSTRSDLLCLWCGAAIREGNNVP
jgi:hypothetical protein